MPQLLTWGLQPSMRTIRVLPQTGVKADALWEVSSTYPGTSLADSKGTVNTSALVRKARVRGKPPILVKNFLVHPRICPQGGKPCQKKAQWEAFPDEAEMEQMTHGPKQRKLVYTSGGTSGNQEAVGSLVFSVTLSPRPP